MRPARKSNSEDLDPTLDDGDSLGARGGRGLTGWGIFQCPRAEDDGHRERQGRNYVVQLHSPDLDQLVAPQHGRRWQCTAALPSKAAAAVELGHHLAISVPFVHFEHQPLPPDQVPGIPGQLPFHVLKEIGWAKDAEGFVSAEQDPDEGVKSYKVVHVGVGDEDVANLQHFAMGKGMEITHIEKESPSIKHEFDIHSGVAEGIMDQLCMKQRFHRPWLMRVLKNYSFFSVKLLYNVVPGLYNLFEHLLSF